MSTERDFDAELMDAISDVVDWLDYEVWYTCPGLEESVRKLRNARMAKLVHQKRTKKED
jgi:hypothetical protein